MNLHYLESATCHKLRYSNDNFRSELNVRESLSFPSICHSFFTDDTSSLNMSITFLVVNCPRNPEACQISKGNSGSHFYKMFEVGEFAI